MGLLKTIKKAVKNVAKDVAQAVGIDTSPKVKVAKPQAEMGPQGDLATRTDVVPRRRSRRGGRGRDSTIITAGSQINSRTLLG